MIKPYSKEIQLAPRHKGVTEKTVWDNFSKFIRARDADYQGYCRCISCTTIKKWNEGIDAGHFIPVGSDLGLKYNEMNVNGQCRACNSFKSGNLIEYRQGMIQKYGEKRVKLLEQSHYFKTSSNKLNQLELNAMNKLYKENFKKLGKEKCL